jgi:hypothetical protein
MVMEPGIFLAKFLRINVDLMALGRHSGTQVNQISFGSPLLDGEVPKTDGKP